MRAAARQDNVRTDSDSVELQRKAEAALERVQRNDVGYGIVDATSYIEMAACRAATSDSGVGSVFYSRSQNGFAG